MDFVDEKKSADAVLSDSFYGSYYLTNYLISMGHTRIAFVGTVLATNSIMDRYLGYSKALIEHGQQYRPDWVIADRNISSGLIDDENLMQLPEDMPTAFFCNCDLTAGKLINKLRRQGYRVPEDISVVGYDNYIHPDFCDIGITSYEVDLEVMAKRCVETLIRRMNHEGADATIQMVEGRIIVKDSVQRI
jgi:LacI family transcriptional regulator/LacI family purine nucleotide synthesis repressor